jgi:hypothetical protein
MARGYIREHRVKPNGYREKLIQLLGEDRKGG